MFECPTIDRRSSVCACCSMVSGWWFECPTIDRRSSECACCSMVSGSLAGQTFEEGRERLVTVVDFPCARGISLTASLTCCHETNIR